MARRHGKKIDFTHWTRFAGVSLAQGAGTVGVGLSSAQHEPETLLRMRGEFTCYGDGALVSGAACEMGVGLILVPEGTGTTVLWSPIADADAPWIWAGYYALAYEEFVTDVIDCPGMTSVRDVIDNKAMRIVRNQELQVVFENVTVGGAMTVNSDIHGRVLAGQ